MASIKGIESQRLCMTKRARTELNFKQKMVALQLAKLSNVEMIKRKF